MIKLDFWGNILGVHSKNAKDIDRVKYIFKKFIYLGEKIADIEIVLTGENDEKCYIDSIIKDKSKGKIEYKDKNSEMYVKWNFDDTPFPPMQLEPFKRKYIVLHGMGVVNQNGQSFIFPAPSLAGKTSLMTYMVSKGYKCISDDLLFIDTETMMVYPYPKPVGIRERGINMIPDLYDIVRPLINDDTLSFTESDSGKKVWLLHLDDIYYDCYVKKGVKIDYIIFPDKVVRKNNYFKKISKDKALMRLMNSLCNSSGDMSQNFTVLTCILDRTKGIYDLPTNNLKKAYEIIESIEKNEA